jgi:hypothetical protein
MERDGNESSSFWSAFNYDDDEEGSGGESD